MKVGFLITAGLLAIAYVMFRKESRKSEPYIPYAWRMEADEAVEYVKNMLAEAH